MALSTTYPDDLQHRFWQLATCLRSSSAEPEDLSTEQASFWRAHSRQRLPNADLAEWLATGGCALEWQRDRGGRAAFVYNRVEVIHTLAAALANPPR